MRSISKSFCCLPLLSLAAALFASAGPVHADACSYGLVTSADGKEIRVGQVGPCPEFIYQVPPPAPNAPCTLKLVASYPMRPDGEGHAVIPFMMDKPRLMIVDTGGAHSTIYSSLVRELSLKTFDPRDRHLEVSSEVGFNGNVMHDMAVVPTISFGVLKFDGATFFVEDDTRSTPLAANEIVGTLAPSHLMTFDLEFDFAHSRLNMYLQHHCPGRAVYWAHDYATIPFKLSPDGHILFDAVVDGKPVTATLDSGAPTSSMDAYKAERLFSISDARANQAKSGSGQHDKSAAHQFKSLTIGGVEIRNPDLLLTPDMMSLGGGVNPPDLIIGLREMTALHLFISYSEEVVYVTDVDAHWARPEPNRPKTGP